MLSSSVCALGAGGEPIPGREHGGQLSVQADLGDRVAVPGLGEARRGVGVLARVGLLVGENAARELREHVVGVGRGDRLDGGAVQPDPLDAATGQARGPVEPVVEHAVSVDGELLVRRQRARVPAPVPNDRPRSVEGDEVGRGREEVVVGADEHARGGLEVALVYVHHERGDLGWDLAGDGLAGARRARSVGL